MMVQPPAKKFVIPSDLSQALRVVEAVVAEATEKGYDQDATFAIRLALDEAVANAIRHGNDGNPRKRVHITYTVSEAEFRISVADEGCGFCPNDVPDPTLDENLERPCGRGVMLMRAYMSDVCYNERGNCVTMVKKRVAAQTAK